MQCFKSSESDGGVSGGEEDEAVVRVGKWLARKAYRVFPLVSNKLTFAFTGHRDHIGLLFSPNKLTLRDDSVNSSISKNVLCNIMQDLSAETNSVFTAVKFAACYQRTCNFHQKF